MAQVKLSGQPPQEMLDDLLQVRDSTVLRTKGRLPRSPFLLSPSPKDGPACLHKTSVTQSAV